MELCEKKLGDEIIDNRVHKRDRKCKQFPVAHNLKGQDGFMLKHRKAMFSVA